MRDVLSKWCDAAVKGIKYPPDRQAVHAELLAHLEDHRDALMEQGMTEKESIEKALDAMGSAKEIAPQLAAIHKPFWGYFLRVNLILMAVLTVLCIWPVWDYATDLNLYDRLNLRTFDVYSSESYGGDTGRTLHHLSQPDVSFSTDGSTFTLTDAAVFTEISAGDGAEYTRLYVLIRQSSLLPRKEHEEYFQSFSVTGWFIARDSLGNAYESFFGQSGNDAPCLNVIHTQSSIFTCTHELWINDFPADAQWVDICYERDGRSYALRVNLTGGDRL